MTLKKKAGTKRTSRSAEPEHQEDLQQEDVPVYLTMDGSQCKRWVNAYVKQGEVVVDGETVEVDITMANVLLRRTQQDKRTGDQTNLFRYATVEETEQFVAGTDISDPENADVRLLAKKARENALGRGDANPQTEEAAQVRKSIEDNRLPRRRRRTAQA